MMWPVVAAKIIKSRNISDGNVKLSGVWFLRVQKFREPDLSEFLPALVKAYYC
jgi:hypothetical protein